MDCKFDVELLQNYVENSIDELEKIFVEEHIKVCRKCRKELTELKLLFWELEGINDSEIQIPDEIESIRESVIEKVLSEETTTFGIKKLFQIQKSNMENSRIYFEFIPGKEAFGNGLKKSSHLIYNVSGKVLKKSFKKLKSR